MITLTEEAFRKAVATLCQWCGGPRRCENGVVSEPYLLGKERYYHALQWDSGGKSEVGCGASALLFAVREEARPEEPKPCVHCEADVPLAGPWGKPSHHVIEPRLDQPQSAPFTFMPCTTPSVEETPTLPLIEHEFVEYRLPSLSGDMCAKWGGDVKLGTFCGLPRSAHAAPEVKR